MFVEEFMTWGVSSGSEQRAEALRILAEQYCKDQIADTDRDAVEQVFLLMADDPAVCVRKELARGIADCESAPRVLIWTLIQDLTEVSAILYEHSPLLRQAELRSAVEEGHPTVQSAVARRDDISAELVRLIAQMGTPEAVAELISNEAVFLGPNLKHEIARRLGSEADIRGLLLDDDTIGAHTREMLVAEAASALKSLVGTRNWDTNGRVEKTVGDATSKAAVAIFEQAGSPSALEYAAHLQHSHRLTATFLVRSACSGNAELVEAALAQLSDTSLERVQSIVDSGRATALRALFDKSGLPKSAYPVISAAMDVWASDGCQENIVQEIIHCVEDHPDIDGAMLLLLGRMACETESASAQYYDRQLLLAA